MSAGAGSGFFAVRPARIAARGEGCVGNAIHFPTVDDSEVGRAREISKEPFHSCPVYFTGVGGEAAEDIDCYRNVSNPGKKTA